MKLLLIMPFCLFQMTLSVCPIEEDPASLAKCIQIDMLAIVAAIRGTNDMTSFCSLADRYMECFKTYTRGCIGFYFGEGTLTELQNIAKYCCNGITSSRECPFNPNVKHKCIDANARVTLSNGSRKMIKQLEIGDRVKTIGINGHLEDTDVIMMMDIGNQSSLFLEIVTYSNRTLRVSSSHLIATGRDQFKLARKLHVNDSIVVLNTRSETPLAEDRIKSIMIEPVEGFAAPLTLAGTLLANDMLVSSYAAIENQAIAHLVMAPVRWWYKMSASKSANFVLRNMQIAKQPNGTHWYPGLLHSLTNQFISSSN